MSEPATPTPGSPPPAGETTIPHWQYVLGVLVVVVVLVLVWQQLIGGGVLEPSDGSTPSPTKVATAAPTASAEAAASPSPTGSAKPTPTPKASPTTAPTAAPTSAPTTAPTTAPTAAPTSVPTAYCVMPGTSLTVAYPADWYTLEVPPFACVPYDDAPITTSSDQSLPDAPVAALADDIAYDDALSELTSATDWQVQSQKQTKVSGLAAVVVEESWIGKAPYTVGTMRYFYLVDNGSDGSVLFITQGLAGDAYDEQKDVVDLMAAQSTIK